MKAARFVSINLTEVRAWGRHGANAGEQDVPQPFEIRAHLGVKGDAACSSDELDDAVDYAALHARIVRIVETQRHRLLERLGAAILDAVMEDERIEMASISIGKPGLLNGATPTVSVAVARGRPDGDRCAKRTKKKKKKKAKHEKKRAQA